VGRSEVDVVGSDTSVEVEVVVVVAAVVEAWLSFYLSQFFFLTGSAGAGCLFRFFILTWGVVVLVGIFVVVFVGFEVVVLVGQFMPC
jgi:hypothetical protein